jgi:hypothetical protein
MLNAKLILCGMEKNKINKLKVFILVILRNKDIFI